MQHAWERKEVYKLEGKRPLEIPRRRWADGIRNESLGRQAGGVWSGFSWFRIGTGRGLL
jgi:hypothetical protein